MSNFAGVKFAVASFALIALSSSGAVARERLYPLTMCGPDLSYLCPIHGYFDSAPFRYNLAIHPGCIKVVSVHTPNGIERRRVLVCG